MKTAFDQSYFVCLLVMIIMIHLAPEVSAADSSHRERSGSIEERIQNVLSQMTLDEKVEQLNIRPPKEKQYSGLGLRSQVYNEHLDVGPVLATNGPRGPRPSGNIPANYHCRRRLSFLFIPKQLLIKRSKDKREIIRNRNRCVCNFEIK